LPFLCAERSVLGFPSSDWHQLIFTLGFYAKSYRSIFLFIAMLGEPIPCRRLILIFGLDQSIISGTTPLDMQQRCYVQVADEIYAYSLMLRCSKKLHKGIE
jgi:hypothetical protein